MEQTSCLLGVKSPLGLRPQAVFLTAIRFRIMISLRYFLLGSAVALFIAPNPVSSANPAKKAAQEERARKRADKGKRPSEKLAELIANAPQILELRYGPLPITGKQLKAAPGELALLRAGFVSEAGTSTPEHKRVLAAAVTICDILTKAIEERVEVIARLQNSGWTSAEAKGPKQKEVSASDKFFIEHIEAEWKARRADTLARLTTAHSTLRAAEAQDPAP